MLNEYEKKKLIQRAVHDDMEKRVSSEAMKEFHREAYPAQHEHARNMLTAKKNLTFLLNHAGALDSWERETVERIATRIKGGTNQDAKC